MTLAKALSITKIREIELKIIDMDALDRVIKEEKNRSESSCIFGWYSKAEYVEAYETIKAAIEKMNKEDK